MVTLRSKIQRLLLQARGSKEDSWRLIENLFRWKVGLGWAVTRYAEVLVRAPLALAHVGVEAQAVLVQVAEHVADNATAARV